MVIEGRQRMAHSKLNQSMPGKLAGLSGQAKRQQGKSNGQAGRLLVCMDEVICKTSVRNGGV